MTSTPYLLSLANLHSAAPGVLDVIFGPDGDFPGAPRWGGSIVHATEPRIRGPLSFWTDATDMLLRERQPNTHGRLHIWFAGGLEGLALKDAALDLRIPSVAARIAALIQQVGGDTGDDMIAESVVNNLDNPRVIAELAPVLAAHFRDPIILARIAALRRTP